jgi:hypothetical protein
MDGLSIGWKVDLIANNSYEKLKCALEDMFQDMFQQFISMSFATSLAFMRSKLLRMIWICLYPGDPQSSTAGQTRMFSSCGQKLNFLYSSGYVLTYEDHESDLLFVGDIPWE